MTVPSKDHIAERLSSHVRKSMPHAQLRKACVLVTLVNNNDQLHLLLTKRTDAVEHHKGQISFPGGMADPGDTSETDTALREIEEEIGVARSSIAILGMLDDIHIPTGFIVTPVVGYIDRLDDLNINADEVAEVLLIPLEKFFDPSLCRTEARELLGQRREIFVFDVWNEPVWGATAHIIRQFISIVSSPAH